MEPRTPMEHGGTEESAATIVAAAVAAAAAHARTDSNAFPGTTTTTTSPPVQTPSTPRPVPVKSPASPSGRSSSPPPPPLSANPTAAAGLSSLSAAAQRIFGYATPLVVFFVRHLDWTAKPSSSSSKADDELFDESLPVETPHEVLQIMKRLEMSLHPHIDAQQIVGMSVPGAVVPLSFGKANDLYHNGSSALHVYLLCVEDGKKQQAPSSNGEKAKSSSSSSSSSAVKQGAKRAAQVAKEWRDDIRKTDGTDSNFVVVLIHRTFFEWEHSAEKSSATYNSSSGHHGSPQKSATASSSSAATTDLNDPLAVATAAAVAAAAAAASTSSTGLFSRFGYSSNKTPVEEASDVISEYAEELRKQKFNNKNIYVYYSLAPCRARMIELLKEGYQERAVLLKSLRHKAYAGRSAPGWSIQEFWRRGYDLAIHHLKFGAIHEAMSSFTALFTEYYNNSDDFAFVSSTDALHRLGQEQNVLDPQRGMSRHHRRTLSTSLVGLSSAGGGGAVGGDLWAYPPTLADSAEILDSLLFLVGGEMTCALLLGNREGALARFFSLLEIIREKFGDKTLFSAAGKTSNHNSGATSHADNNNNHSSSLHPSSLPRSLQHFFLMRCCFSALDMCTGQSLASRIGSLVLRSTTTSAAVPTARAGTHGATMSMDLSSLNNSTLPPPAVLQKEAVSSMPLSQLARRARNMSYNGVDDMPPMTSSSLHSFSPNLLASSSSGGGGAAWLYQSNDEDSDRWTEAGLTELNELEGQWIVAEDFTRGVCAKEIRHFYVSVGELALTARIHLCALAADCGIPFRGGPLLPFNSTMDATKKPFDLSTLPDDVPIAHALDVLQPREPLAKPTRTQLELRRWLKVECLQSYRLFIEAYLRLTRFAANSFTKGMRLRQERALVCDQAAVLQRTRPLAAALLLRRRVLPFYERDNWIQLLRYVRVQFILCVLEALHLRTLLTSPHQEYAFQQQRKSGAAGGGGGGGVNLNESRDSDSGGGVSSNPLHHQEGGGASSSLSIVNPQALAKWERQTQLLLWLTEDAMKCALIEFSAAGAQGDSDFAASLWHRFVYLDAARTALLQDSERDGVYVDMGLSFKQQSFPMDWLMSRTNNCLFVFPSSAFSGAPSGGGVGIGGGGAAISESANAKQFLGTPHYVVDGEVYGSDLPDGLVERTMTSTASEIQEQDEAQLSDMADLVESLDVSFVTEAQFSGKLKKRLERCARRAWGSIGGGGSNNDATTSGAFAPPMSPRGPSAPYFSHHGRSMSLSLQFTGSMSLAGGAAPLSALLPPTPLKGGSHPTSATTMRTSKSNNPTTRGPLRCSVDDTVVLVMLIPTFVDLTTALQKKKNVSAQDDEDGESNSVFCADIELESRKSWVQNTSSSAAATTTAPPPPTSVLPAQIDSHVVHFQNVPVTYRAEASALLITQKFSVCHAGEYRLKNLTLRVCGSTFALPFASRDRNPLTGELGSLLTRGSRVLLSAPEPDIGLSIRLTPPQDMHYFSDQLTTMEAHVVVTRPILYADAAASVAQKPNESVLMMTTGDELKQTAASNLASRRRRRSETIIISPSKNSTFPAVAPASSTTTLGNNVDSPHNHAKSNNNGNGAVQVSCHHESVINEGFARSMSVAPSGGDGSQSRNLDGLSHAHSSHNSYLLGARGSRLYEKVISLVDERLLTTTPSAPSTQQQLQHSSSSTSPTLMILRMVVGKPSVPALQQTLENAVSLGARSMSLRQTTAASFKLGAAASSMLMDTSTSPTKVEAQSSLGNESFFLNATGGGLSFAGQVAKAAAEEGGSELMLRTSSQMHAVSSSGGALASTQLPSSHHQHHHPSTSRQGGASANSRLGPRFQHIPFLCSGRMNALLQERNTHLLVHPSDGTATIVFWYQAGSRPAAAVEGGPSPSTLDGPASVRLVHDAPITARLPPSSSTVLPPSGTGNGPLSVPLSLPTSPTNPSSTPAPVCLSANGVAVRASFPYQKHDLMCVSVAFPTERVAQLGVGNNNGAGTKTLLPYNTEFRVQVPLLPSFLPWASGAVTNEGTTPPAPTASEGKQTQSSSSSTLPPVHVPFAFCLVRERELCVRIEKCPLQLHSAFEASFDVSMYQARTFVLVRLRNKLHELAVQIHDVDLQLFTGSFGDGDELSALVDDDDDSSDEESSDDRGSRKGMGTAAFSEEHGVEYDDLHLIDEAAHKKQQRRRKAPRPFSIHLVTSPAIFEQCVTTPTQPNQVWSFLYELVSCEDYLAPSELVEHQLVLLAAYGTASSSSSSFSTPPAASKQRAVQQHSSRRLLTRTHNLFVSQPHVFASRHRSVFSVMLLLDDGDDDHPHSDSDVDDEDDEDEDNRNHNGGSESYADNDDMMTEDFDGHRSSVLFDSPPHHHSPTGGLGGVEESSLGRTPLGTAASDFPSAGSPLLLHGASSSNAATLFATNHELARRRQQLSVKANAGGRPRAQFQSSHRPHPNPHYGPSTPHMTTASGGRVYQAGEIVRLRVVLSPQRANWTFLPLSASGHGSSSNKSLFYITLEAPEDEWLVVGRSRELRCLSSDQEAVVHFSAIPCVGPSWGMSPAELAPSPRGLKGRTESVVSTAGSTAASLSGGGPRIVNIAVPRVTLQHCIDPILTQQQQENVFPSHGNRGVVEVDEPQGSPPLVVVGPKLGCPGSSLAVGPLVPVDIVLSRTQIAVRI